MWYIEMGQSKYLDLDNSRASFTLHSKDRIVLVDRSNFKTF